MFTTNLRAPEDRKGASSGDCSSKETQNSAAGKKDASSSNSKPRGEDDANSPKKRPIYKRKGGPQDAKVYRRVDHLALPSSGSLISPDEIATDMVVFTAQRVDGNGATPRDGGAEVREPKKEETYSSVV